MDDQQSHDMRTQIIEKIILETKNYNEAIRSNKVLWQVREIRIKIKNLVEELRNVMSEKEINETAYLTLDCTLDVSKLLTT